MIDEQKNAIHPYTWVAHYYNGGVLRQFDMDGVHNSTEIDPSRLQELTIHGHPSGPIRIFGRSGERQADEVVIRAVVSMIQHTYNGHIYRLEQVRDIVFGVRFEMDEMMIRIGADGHVRRQVMPMTDTCRKVMAQ